MSLLVRTFRWLKWSRNRQFFIRKAKAILDTRPLAMRGTSPLFLSMIRHDDVTNYLLAIKSLYTGVGQGRVKIINDGSLSAGDLVLLNHHVPGLEVLDIAAIATGACPRGGTWERLIKILELSRENYVIQVDADILVSGFIPEVVDCWRENRSFLLGTGSGRAISTVEATAAMVQGWIKTNGWTVLPVGVEAEAALDRLPEPAEKLYVHASSGFAGFAEGVFATVALERFSGQMSAILGNRRWREWGSEQIASNYMLANAPGATVLPFPRYACFEPGLNGGNHALLHFIGTYRYDNGAYRRLAVEFLDRFDRLPDSWPT